ncbi:hypothetical protein [Agrobacterium sp. T29]|uniref:hypothetical protein n=1 Tax=Agrobacterium sp. T29 TaxID=2580515 RepID=UPI00143CF2D0|nr:hypothetical protein [Agrobacterium sp. T29]
MDGFRGRSRRFGGHDGTFRLKNDKTEFMYGFNAYIKQGKNLTALEKRDNDLSMEAKFSREYHPDFYPSQPRKQQ